MLMRNMNHSQLCEQVFADTVCILRMHIHAQLRPSSPAATATVRRGKYPLCLYIVPSKPVFINT